MPGHQPPRLLGAARLRPVVQTRMYGGTTITLIGLEFYADGFLADFRVLPRGGRLRDPRLLVRCRDDRGGRYRAWRERSNGGGAGDGAGDGRWLIAYGFAPAPGPSARELRLEVAKVRSRDATTMLPGSWTFTVGL